jgi:hypothetical protein
VTPNGPELPANGGRGQRADPRSPRRLFGIGAYPMIIGLDAARRRCFAIARRFRSYSESSCGINPVGQLGAVVMGQQRSRPGTSRASDNRYYVVENRFTRGHFCVFRPPELRNHPRARTAGGRKAPRHEIAGCGAPTVQRALWGFGADVSVGEADPSLSI